MNQIERIARVEEQVYQLKVKVDRLEGKIDQLLELKDKGAGAFWFASALIGTGVVGLIVQFFHFLGGK